LPVLLVVAPPGPESDALASTLETKGFRVLRADRCAPAVEVALRHLPDAIVLDPTLSPMDRWHAVRRLGSEPTTAKIPLVPLSSGAAVDPVALKRLLTRLDVVVGPLSTPEPARTIAVRPVPRPAPVRRADDPLPVPVEAPELPEVPVAPGSGRIVLADEREGLASRLRRAGYEVEVARTGEAALAAIDRSPPELVLVGRGLPDVSGVELVRRIRRTRSALELPVLVVTSRVEPSEVVAALEAEANDHLAEPVGFEVVKARIRSHLALARAHRERVAREGLLAGVAVGPLAAPPTPAPALTRSHNPVTRSHRPGRAVGGFTGGSGGTAGAPLVLAIVVGDVGGLSVDGLSDRVTSELRKVLGVNRDE
jgi:DNA-binding response OmpR family regulator